MVVGLRTCEEHRYDFESQASYHVASTSSRWGALISGCVYGGQKGRDLLFCICMQLLKNGGVNRDAATMTAECISYAL